MSCPRPVLPHRRCEAPQAPRQAREPGHDSPPPRVPPCGRSPDVRRPGLLRRARNDGFPARTRTAGGHAGFTLIEIMVVVVILGILASLVVPRVMSRPDEARQVTARQDVKSIAAALQLYRLDNYAYPSTVQGLAALVEAPAGEPPAPNWKGPYLERVPQDPWQRPYLYLSPGAHGEVDVYSLGADGAPGGEGPNADIGNWQG